MASDRPGLNRVCCLTWLAACAAVCSLSVRAQEHADSPVQPARGTAVIVLVGEASRDPELAALLSELLARETVEALCVQQAQFRPNALLAIADGDARVQVFITLDKAKLARLYFRGPFGRRFLLRDLELPNGLDEVGRESIAQVVATSTVSVLASDTGIDRAALQARLAERTEPQAPALPPPVVVAQRPTPAAPAVRAAWLQYELAARLGAGWTGSPSRTQLGVGGETGLAFHSKSRFFHRERLAGLRSMCASPRWRCAAGSIWRARSIVRRRSWH